jgi:TonB family protein
MHPFPFLATVAIKAALLLAAAFLSVAVLRRASASARYFVWACAFGAVLTLPLLMTFPRGWKLRLPTPANSAIPAIHESITVQGAGPVQRTWPPATWLIMVWAAGAGLMLVRIGAGHARLGRMLRRTEPVGDFEASMIDEIGRRFGLSSRPDIRVSPEIDVPLAFGLFRPSIILPSDAGTWSPERQRVVLLHELAHIRRMDPLWHLLANLVVALHWFNPLAWLAAARFSREQEWSCDDAVLALGLHASAYAEHLLDLARSIVAPAQWPTAAIGMAEESDLEARIRALLDSRRKRGGITRRFALAAVSAAIALVVPVAAVHAQASGSASLSGFVYDPSGAAVPNATVLLSNTDGSNEEIARADAAGQYAFRGVPTGRYAIEVRAPGFAKLQQSGVTLAEGASANLDLTLRLGEINENVRVLGRGPQLAPTSPAQRIRVGGNVQATKLLSKVRPVYPPDAEAEGVEGTVLLKAVISKQGDLMSVTVLNKSVDPRLAKAATDAVAQWKYQPTLLNGAPVEVVTTVSVNFELQH